MSIPSTDTLAAEATAILSRLGVAALPHDGDLVVRDRVPVDRELRGVRRFQVDDDRRLRQHELVLLRAQLHDAGRTFGRSGTAHFFARAEDREVHHDEHDDGDERDAFGMFGPA